MAAISGAAASGTIQDHCVMGGDGTPVTITTAETTLLELEPSDADLYRLAVPQAYIQCTNGGIAVTGRVYYKDADGNWVLYQTITNLNTNNGNWFPSGFIHYTSGSTQVATAAAKAALCETTVRAWKFTAQAASSSTNGYVLATALEYDV